MITVISCFHPVVSCQAEADFHCLNRPTTIYESNQEEGRQEKEPNNRVILGITPKLSWKCLLTRPIESWYNNR